MTNLNIESNWIVNPILFALKFISCNQNNNTTMEMLVDNYYTNPNGTRRNNVTQQEKEAALNGFQVALLEGYIIQNNETGYLYITEKGKKELEE